LVCLRCMGDALSLQAALFDFSLELFLAGIGFSRLGPLLINRGPQAVDISFRC
jgi:hypothetical protein